MLTVVYLYNSDQDIARLTLFLCSRTESGNVEYSIRKWSAIRATIKYKAGKDESYYVDR